MDHFGTQTDPILAPLLVSAFSLLTHFVPILVPLLGVKLGKVRWKGRWASLLWWNRHVRRWKSATATSSRQSSSRLGSSVEKGGWFRRARLVARQFKTCGHRANIRSHINHGLAEDVDPHDAERLQGLRGHDLGRKRCLPHGEPARR